MAALLTRASAFLLAVGAFALPRPAVAQETPPGAPQAPPEIRSIEIRGATVYDLKYIQRIIRVEPGAPLRRPAAELALLVERRYRIMGYAAARVEGNFEPATGTLSLFVDEGRLASVEIEGVEGEAEERALQVLDLEAGKPVKEQDIAAGLARLEKQSGGAFVSTSGTPYTLEPGPDGVRLKLQLQRRVARVQFRPGGPAGAWPYNRVDGFSLGARALVTLFDPASFNHAELYTRVSYGFASEKVRYSVGALKPFGPGRRFVLGYEYHDLTDTDDNFRGRGTETLPGRLIYFEVFEDYYRRRGHEAFAFTRVGRLQFGAAWRSEDYRSLPVVADNRLFFSDERRPNPPVTEGLMRTIAGSVRWAGKGDLYTGWPTERVSLLQRDLFATPFERSQQVRLDATVEVASPGLGGDFSFQRYIGHVRAAHWFSPRSALVLRGLVGIGEGDLPPQRILSLGGMGTLRGYDTKEFTGDHAGLVTAEYWLYPRSPWPGFSLFYDGGTAWTAGQPRPGWKGNLGAGLEWPGGGRGYVRIDVAYPLASDTTSHGARVTGFFRFPF